MLKLSQNYTKRFFGLFRYKKVFFLTQILTHFKNILTQNLATKKIRKHYNRKTLI